MVKLYTIFFLFVVGFSTAGMSQQPEKLKVQFGKPISFVAQDSSFSLNLGARIQTMAEVTHSEGAGNTIADFYIRRLRLNLAGHALSPKFSYRIQLSFSKRDINADNEEEEDNLFLRDAMLFYEPNKNWKIGFGQTKLSGNRQRQISSANLQFPDRSNTNALFTLDRDRGLWITHTKAFNGVANPVWKNTFAVTAGEGRVSNDKSNGLSYSFRTEYLPFGKFKEEGEYIESDIFYEENVKLAIAASYSYNSNARRELGQLGEYLFNNQVADIKYYGADLMLKYRGWSLLGEMYFRQAKNGISIHPTNPSKVHLVYTGRGLLLQTGYLFTSKDEVALRFGRTEPDAAANQYIDPLNEYAVAYSHYFYKHNLKLQTDIGYLTSPTDKNLRWRLTGIIGF